VLPELQAYFTFSDVLAVSGDFVFKGHRVVIPVGYREQILARLHSSHIDINSCIRRARETCYFLGITAEIKRLFFSLFRLCSYTYRIAERTVVVT